MTTNYFARQIGLSRAERIYRIKKQQNAISHDLAQRIVDRFPEINIAWLKIGYGEMLNEPEQAACTKPYFNCSIEDNIQNIDSLVPCDQIMLPIDVDFDLAMPYTGYAMGSVTPPNTILLLKNILPEMIIPGDECVIVTKKNVLLRIAKFEEGDNDHIFVRLVAINSDTYGDITIKVEEIVKAYKVKSKILINR